MTCTGRSTPAPSRPRRRRVHRRRALRRQARHLLPRDARHGHGHGARRRRRACGSRPAASSRRRSATTCARTRGAKVLIMAAEDYSGKPGDAVEFPAYASRTAPNYIDYYKNALTAAGISYDVYDVDAENRTAPDPMRRAVALRGGRLVHRQRRADPRRRRPGRHRRRQARQRRDPRRARLPQRRRQAALHGPERRLRAGQRVPVQRARRAAVLRRRDAGEHAGLHRAVG